jgi:ABC-2 type transport system ATP-binding protein
LHDPDLVVLDEPIIGLDLASKERLRAFLAEINAERGVTLLLTTCPMCSGCVVGWW